MAKTGTRRCKPRRGRLTLISVSFLILGVAAIIAVLIRFEKAIPPLLADQLPKASSVLVEKAERRLSLLRDGQVNGWGWAGLLGPYLYRTHGCIAVRNTAMEEIWSAVDDGTPIEIRP